MLLMPGHFQETNLFSLHAPCETKRRRYLDNLGRLLFAGRPSKAQANIRALLKHVVRACRWCVASRKRETEETYGLIICDVI